MHPSDLQRQVLGRVIWPDSPGYDDSRRLFNDLYPAHPRVVVYVANEQDIGCCLSYARENNLTTVVRSGGHSMAGYSVCDGMVIDLSDYNGIRVNAGEKTAVVEAGCKIHALESALERESLHVPGGGCPTVAVAGYMMGGGYGFTSRTYGLNCDHVIAVRMMLADGSVVTASANDHADLFWAVRGGGGGNFGILLTITYRLHELKELAGTRLEYPIETPAGRKAAGAAMSFIQDTILTGNAHPELGVQLIMQTDPGDGKKKLIVCLSWVGGREQLDQVMAPLLAFPEVRSTLSLRGSYSAVNAGLLSKLEAIPPGVQAYCCSQYVEKPMLQMDFEGLLEFYAATVPNEYAIIALEGYGGQINAVDRSATAFYHRTALFNVFAFGFFSPGVPDQRARSCHWIQQVTDALQDYSNGHAYQNYPNRFLSDYRWAYWGSHYPRLQRVQQRYDPHDFFSYGQAIGGQPMPKLKDRQINTSVNAGP